MGRRSRQVQERRARPLRAEPPPPAEAVPRPGRSPLAALRRRQYSQREFDRYTGHLVALARDAGHSWREVGDALGMTGEGARKRYGID